MHVHKLLIYNLLLLIINFLTLLILTLISDKLSTRFDNLLGMNQ